MACGETLNLTWSRICRDCAATRALTADVARADDLVQDTIERALRKLDLWQPGTQLRAWLFTLMHSVYINQLRERPHDTTRRSTKHSICP